MDVVKPPKSQNLPNSERIRIPLSIKNKISLSLSLYLSLPLPLPFSPCLCLIGEEEVEGGVKFPLPYVPKPYSVGEEMEKPCKVTDISPSQIRSKGRR